MVRLKVIEITKIIFLVCACLGAFFKVVKVIAETIGVIFIIVIIIVVAVASIVIIKGFICEKAVRLLASDAT